MGLIRTLTPTEVVRDRPFTNPDRIVYDVNTLRYMVDQLCLFIEDNERQANLKPPVIVHQPSRDRWFYRLVITQPEKLMLADELEFVGFLGHRREDANRALADEFDEILVDEIPDHPGLLSYSTMAMLSGDFSNLVVFSDQNVKKAWSQGRTHEVAVQKITPDYYLSIKLYNGKLPGGIIASRALQLTRVKYYDYQVNPRWHAVREFSVGS